MYDVAVFDIVRIRGGAFQEMIFWLHCGEKVVRFLCVL